jgi:ATP-dependent Lon protease
MINDYCREPGVRSLQRYVNRIFSKVALKIIQNEKNIIISEENLKDYIGPAIFSSKKLYDKLPRGVAIGLGFNNYGGAILYVESSKTNYLDKSTGMIKVTGNLGNVMQESCSIALTFVKSFLQSFKNEDQKNVREFFDTQQIHVHFTEGAIQKVS